METKNVTTTGLINAQLEASRAEKKQTEKAKEADRQGRKQLLPGDFAVNLSTQAKDLAVTRQKALDIARATNPIREDRVAELKSQIQRGEYKVDPGKIADGMLTEAIRDKLAQESQT